MSELAIESDVVYGTHRASLAIGKAIQLDLRCWTPRVRVSILYAYFFPRHVSAHSNLAELQNKYVSGFPIALNSSAVSFTSRDCFSYRSTAFTHVLYTGIELAK
jgi:hypothetical protein